MLLVVQRNSYWHFWQLFSMVIIEQYLIHTTNMFHKQHIEKEKNCLVFFSILRTGCLFLLLRLPTKMQSSWLECWFFSRKHLFDLHYRPLTMQTQTCNVWPVNESFAESSHEIFIIESPPRVLLICRKHPGVLHICIKTPGVLHICRKPPCMAMVASLGFSAKLLLTGHTLSTYLLIK